MIIVLKTKAFADKRDKKKKPSNSYSMEDGCKEYKKRMENDKKNQKPKPNQDPPKTKKDQDLQNKIDRTNKEIELEEKKIKLKELKKGSEPDRIDKVKEKAKSIIENPKFKKGAKIAGLSALGAGITVGAILGGRKIKQKIDEKNSNNRIKKSIMEDPEKEEQ